MIDSIKRVTCDNCNRRVAIDTQSSAEAAERVRKLGWIEIDHGYGNSTQYCSLNCRNVKAVEMGYPAIEKGDS